MPNTSTESQSRAFDGTNGEYRSITIPCENYLNLSPQIKEYVEKPNMAPIVLEWQGRYTGHVELWEYLAEPRNRDDDGEENTLLEKRGS